MTDKVDWSSFEVVDTPASSVDWESFEVVASGKEKQSAWRRAGDIGISAVKSAIGVPEAAVGLADIVTGGKAGKMAEWAGFKPREAKAFLDEYLSPQQKEANKAVSDAEGFVDTAAAAIRNPSVIGHTALESLGAMGAGGLVGRGVAGAAKIAPWLAGAIGEGVVGAGSAAEQIRQQSADGELSLGQSAAAVGSGIGTAAFGAAGGRIAQKLGVADIDTVLAAGGKGMSSKGIAARIIGGGLSEGVFEELPQSVQEQIFQNAALDKPLMDGVPESAAMGLVTGAAMGGVAGGAISGKVNQQTAEDEAPDAAPTDPLLLTNSSTQNLIAFPDGSVGTQADVDSFINGLPEGDRIAARARLLNLGEQEVKPTIEDIAAAPTVDDAIATAQAVVAAPPEIDIEIKNQQIDQAFSEHMAGIRQQQFDLAEQARRDADVSTMQAQAAEQQVEQANALTQAQGFDAQEPTAMELAMVAAQQRRELLTTPVSQRVAIVEPAPAVQAAEPLQQEAINEPVPTPTAAAPVLDDGVGSAGIPATEQPSQTQGLAPVQAPAEIRGGDVAAATVPSVRTSVSDTDSAVGESAALTPKAVTGNGIPDSAQVAAEPPVPSTPLIADQATVDRAKKVLGDAKVLGRDRIELIEKIRSGQIQLADLEEAYPASASQPASQIEEKLQNQDAQIPSTSSPMESVDLADQSLSSQTDTNQSAQQVEYEESFAPPKDSNSTLKSTAPVASGLTAEAVTKSLTRVRAKWLGFSKVNTVQSVADLPADIAKRANADDKTEAIYDPQTKSVHLIADNIKSPERAVWVSVHEVVGHGGLRMLKDKSVNQALNIAGLNRFVRDLAQAIGKERGDTNNQVEEAVAELAAAIETNDFQALADRYGVTVPEASRNGLRGTIARVLESIKRFLSAVMGKPVADVSDADARNLIKRQREAVESRQSADREVEGDTAMASTRADQTKTAAFRKWFGKSHVVDDDGKPLVVYHGTANMDGDGIEIFRGPRVPSSRYLSRLGQFHGIGSFFSESADVAGSFPASAESGSLYSTYPVYMSIQNPKRYRSLTYALKDFNEGHGGKPVEYVDALKEQGFDGIYFTEGPSYAGKKRELQAGAWVAFHPEQIKSATGNSGAFDPNSANILQSRAPTQWTIPDQKKILGVGVDDFLYRMQDKTIDTRRAVEAINKLVGKLKDEIDPRLQETLFAGRSSKQTHDFAERELKPLMLDMKARGVDFKDFEEFLHARHAKERNEQIAKINPKMQDKGSGMSTADADKYMKGLKPEQRKAYDALASRVDKINDGTRKLLVEAGLEKQSTIDAWDKSYKHYVPLQRAEMDEPGMGIGQGFSVKGASTKRALGSEKEVIDIIANIALQRERAIVRAEKNKVSQAVYGLSVKEPNADFWLSINPRNNASMTPAQYQEMEFELIALGLEPEDAQLLVREPKQRYVDPRTGLVSERINPTLRSAPNVLAFRVNGEDRFVVFNTKEPRAQRMVTALKNLDADQMGAVLSASAMASRWFAQVNTQWNPVFGMMNLTRDVQSALLNLSTTEIKGKQAEVLKHTASALLGIYSDIRSERGGKQASSKWAELYEEFQKEGGKTGFRQMFSNSQERMEKLRDEIEQISEGKLKHAGRAVFSWLSDYNEALENAVRLAAYKVGTDNGMSKQRAAAMAKELTVNFNRKGQVALQAGALYAFFNAAVQGTARTYETLTGPMGKKILAGGLILGSMQAIAFALAGYDDDEPPQFVRERSLIIPLDMFGLEKKYASIPMPLGFHVIPSMSRIVTEWALSGGKDTAKRVMDIGGLFADAFNPIGNAGISMQTVAPTALDPFTALIENKDFAGRPIAREDMSGLRQTPGYTRAKDTASWYAKELSYYLNLMSGGTKFKPGVFSPTPDQIDYLIGQAGGGTARELSKVEQLITSAVTGEELPTYKMPLVGRLYGDTESKSAESSKFYANIKLLNSHKLEIDGRRKEHEPITDYIKENPEAKLIGLVTRTQSEVSELNKLKRKLLERDAPKERIKLIEMQITTKMKRLNDRVESVRED